MWQQTHQFMTHLLALTFSALFVVLMTTKANAQSSAVSFAAVAQEIQTGDKLTVYNPDIGLLPVKLALVDAPQAAMGSCKAQPWADVSAKALAAKVKDQVLQINCLSQPLATGYALCEIFVDGEESINMQMIREGHAWFDRSSGDFLWLQRVEQEAKKRRAGMWGSNLALTPPWEQRKRCLGYAY